MAYTEEFKAEKVRIDGDIKVGSELLYLTQKQCMENGPSVDETLDIVRKTFVAHGKKEYEMPAKIGIHPHADVFYHAMPAYVPGQMACGCKWIGCYPRNPREYQLPQTTSLLVLNELMTGIPVAVMDGAWITAMRTPAVTAVAAELLHPDAEHFGMFGCGVQGMGHVRFVSRTLKKLKKIYLYDVHEEAVDALIAQLQDEVGPQLVKTASPKEVMDNCEVVASATIITLENLAVVKEAWVRPGQTLFPCDLNTFWEASIQRNADKYIVDSREEHELFAKMGYFPDGLPSIFCETGEVVAGLAKGRENKEQVIVCSNIGMSVFDVAVAKVIFDKALANKGGQKLPM